jgi:hypothetical protein
MFFFADLMRNILGFQPLRLGLMPPLLRGEVSEKLSD